MWTSGSLHPLRHALAALLLLAAAPVTALADQTLEGDAYREETEDEPFRSAPGDHGVRCRPEACTAVADTYVADQQAAGGNRVKRQPMDENWNPVMIPGHNGMPMEQILYVGYGVAVSIVGGGDAAAGLRKLIDEIKSLATRRTVIGCPGELCRCGSLQVARRANVGIKGMVVPIDVEDDGDRDRFFFEHDVTVNRVVSRGTCEEVPMDVHTGEFPHPQ